MTIVMGANQLQSDNKEKNLTLSPFLRHINLWWSRKKPFGVVTPAEPGSIPPKAGLK
jgi:hypothetical protein